MLHLLPPELLDLVFGSLKLGDLASTSAVCRTWQVASFPLLYKEMYICRPEHLKALRTRIAAKNIPNVLSVAAHVEGLTFDCHRGELVADWDLNPLDDIVPQLTRLSSFAWKMNFMPFSLPSTLYEVSLKSVHLESTSLEDPDDEWYKELGDLLAFEDLTHFHFKVNDLSPGFNKRYIEAFSDLFERCPTLESIELNLFNDVYKVEPYFADMLLTQDFYAPRLHTFRLLGDVDIEWPMHISGAHPLCAFLARHTLIEDLALGHGQEYYDRPTDVINPEDLAQILPSLRHFTGPLLLCEALVRSSLATQLESLVIFADQDTDKDTLESISKLFYETNLPKLRKIKLVTHGSYKLESAVVESMVKGSKALEELEFQQGLDHYPRFLGALAGADHLQQITLDHHKILQCAIADSDPGIISNWDDVVMDVVRTCPRLERIVSRNEGAGEIQWRVLRQESGHPNVVKVNPGS
ncbi:unnamed protein product [Rhizoctonia solani]|uniref:F-box domain-containing protein n=1 Tax=Rhizoctonia solani TaxID=456999 RepID=A0A8H3BUG9_9AGAM|nr:unnamed protein product [Rhizoctonia solani]CAE6466705.1 unnamed protein product [Rhizoctonia solani]